MPVFRLLASALISKQKDSPHLRPPICLVCVEMLNQQVVLSLCHTKGKQATLLLKRGVQFYKQKQLKQLMDFVPVILSLANVHTKHINDRFVVSLD